MTAPENTAQAQAQQQAAHCQLIYRSCDDAIRWISDNRAAASRLNNEADALILKCRRVRNLTQSLGQTALRPVTVGFFGLSQAGKSYLISTLAAGSNGRLETQLGPQKLDFLQHINPPGGGKEATGLVTRFTRHTQPVPDDYPLELALFSEVEVIKILANAFFNDFNAEKFQYHYQESKLRELLSQLSAKRAPGDLPGINQDQVVELWDYLQERFTSSMNQLGSHYWDTAISLAPGLQIADRTRLFAPLWGEIAELSAVYQDFAETLAQLGNVRRVFAPLSALVEPLGNGEFSQSNSIINVDILERLGAATDSDIQVVPFAEGERGQAVSVSRARLAALTVELKFPLKEAPRHAMFEQVDLLDFPGYRGRLDVESLDDVKRAVKSANANPVAQLVLRGKVAYLFERYTDTQSMNLLIVCTASHKQSDVTSLGPALTEWIHKTQGPTPQVRKSHRCGLLWAITMFDLRIQNSLSHSEDMLSMGWSGMIKMAMLERFGQYEWMQQWTTEQAFNNVFLVRKPGIDVPFISQDQPGNEQMLADKYRDNLSLMQTTYLADASVQRHIDQPLVAWDAMLQLNDGGISRLADYLNSVSSPQLKLARLQEQINDVVHELADNRLGAYFVSEGESEVEKKKQLAAQIIDAIKKRWLLTGDILLRLQPPPAVLRSAYLRANTPTMATQERSKDTDASSQDEVAGALDLGDNTFDMPEFDTDTGDTDADDSGEAIDTGNSNKPKPDSSFAAVAIREWIAHLRALPENNNLIVYLGLPRSALECLTDELICAIERLSLDAQLATKLREVELQAGVRRDQLVERQIMTIKLFISDFLSSLTLDISDLNPPALIAADQLPSLNETPLDYTKLFIRDWFMALTELVVSNAGHSAGQEISPQQNQALGQIISQIRGSQSES